MGFWNTLGSVRANRTNFKQWEKDEADNDAKRKELYQRNPLSEQELKEKQKLAETIIDTITIMDEQSENMSEDVEAVTQSIAATSMPIGFLLSGAGAVFWIKKLLKKNYKDIENVDNLLTKEQYKKIIEANKTNKKFKNEIFSVYEIKNILVNKEEYKKLIVPKE